MTALARNFNPTYLHSAPVYNPANNGRDNPVRGPQPLATHTIFPTRRKYQLVRMKEMLSNALSGNRGGGLFAVHDPNHRGATQAQQSARQGYFPGSGGAGGGSSGGAGGGGSGMVGSDGFAIPSAISVPSTANTTTSDAMAEAQRRAVATAAGTAGGGGGGAGGPKSATRRLSTATAVSVGAD